ncbi:MAG: autotransporter domain-containing protein [Elusimicrobiota bacterium]|nr:autotransporter domain-containing protein [Elusimicrobiota bacterium]
MKIFKPFLNTFLSVVIISLFSISSIQGEDAGTFAQFSSLFSAGTVTFIQLSGGHINMNAALLSPASSNLNKIDGLYGGTRWAFDGGYNNSAVFILENSSITFSNTQFRRFSRVQSGGAFSLISGSKISFDGNIDFTSNTALNGGAVNLLNNPENYQFVQFSAAGSTINFSYNTAMSSGGAISASASDIFINASLGGIVRFTSNTAGSNQNDIYLGAKSNLFVNALDASKVEMLGGIQGASDSKIVKTGTGDFFLGGLTAYNGEIEIKGGTLSFVSNSVYINSLSVSDSDLRVYINNWSDWTTNTLIKTDILKISNADLLVSISTSSSLYEGAQIPIIYFSQLDGAFTDSGRREHIGDWRYALYYESNYVSLHFTSNTILSFDGLNHNQSEVQNALNSIYESKSLREHILDDMAQNPEQVKRLLNAMSGSFLVDSIRAAQVNSNSIKIYNRIGKNLQKDKRLIWAQVDIQGVSLTDKDMMDKFSMSGAGGLFGIDLFEFEEKKTNTIIGAYLSYDGNSLKQGLDKGSANVLEIGGYGSLLGLFEDRMIIKGNMGFALQMFDTQREIREYINPSNTSIDNPKANFNIYTIISGAEIEYMAKEYDNTAISPFFGLQTSLSINPEITEKDGGIANLTLDSDSYLRMQAALGAKISGNKDNFYWYGRFYLGFLLAGSHPQYDIRFSVAKDAGSMKIDGADEGFLSMGFGAGGEYRFNETVSAFANIDANLGGDFSKYFVSLGLTYKIPITAQEEKPVKKPVAAQEQKESQIESVEEETIDEKEYMNIEDRDITPDELNAKKEEAVARRKGRIIKSFILKNTFPSSVYRLETNEARQEIEEIANFIKANPYRKVTIEGHTDSSGSEIINQRLSRMRARSVFEELFKNGIDVNKMEYIGFGSALPAATNTTNAGKDKNRRVEIFVE